MTTEVSPPPEQDTRYEYRNEPVQWTEPLPDWVQDEVMAHRDKLPELRAGICQAIAGSKGILKKSETNQEQKYNYTGFDSILDAVRLPMAQAGVSIDQVTCDLEAEVGYANKYGNVLLWKWRAIYLITHSSGAAVARIVRTFTSPGNKSASIASSQCDRLLITRLMRIASGRDESAAEPEQQHATYPRDRPNPNRQPNQRPPQTSAPGSSAAAPAAAPPAAAVSKKHREFSEEQQKAAAAQVDAILAAFLVTTTRARMLSWGRVIRGSSAGWPKLEAERAWAAFEARCLALGIKPNELSAEIKQMAPLAFAAVTYDSFTGEMYERGDGTLL